MFIIQIVEGTLKTAGNFIGYLFKHRILILIGVLALVASMAIGTYNNQNEGKRVEVPDYQRDMPETRYLGQTASSGYLIESYDVQGELTFLIDYYAFDNKWIKQKQPLQLKTKNIKITER